MKIKPWQMMTTLAVTALAFSAPPLASAQEMPSTQPVHLPKPGQPLMLNAGGQPIQVELVADGLVSPWDIEFLPDDQGMLVTESPGRLRLIRDGKLVPQPVWKVPNPVGHDVLHGVVLSPDFAQNHFVYVSYAKTRPLKPGEKKIMGPLSDGVPRTLAISRGRLENGQLVDVHEIFVADAWGQAIVGIGGRMLFGPEGNLYVTVGDRDAHGFTDDDSIRIQSQQLDSDVGKVLRLTADGGIPKDNPFVGQDNANPEVFTYGNRSTYGLAFQPKTGELWSTDIGPNGGDELNILVSGHNYGWPLVSLGRSYSGRLVSKKPWYRPGMDMPVFFWTPVISPSSLIFYTGSQFPNWKGDLFIAALSGQRLVHFSFNRLGLLSRPSHMLANLGVRFRDIEQGPDGNIYLTTEVTFGSPKADGTVLRIVPAK